MITIDDTLIDGKNVITDEFEISNTFKEHYIDIYNKIGTTLRFLNNSHVVGEKIIESYQNHHSA